MEFWPLVSLLLLICISSSLSARIAGFHAVGGSQYINIRNALEELASRGHEVLMVAPSSQKVNPSEKVPHKIYQVPLYKPGFVEKILVPLELEGTKLHYMFKMSEVLAYSCEAVLNNTEVLDALKGFDMIVYDTLGMCAALVGELLGIPRVEIYPIAPSFTLSVIHMIPIPVSYVPMIVLPFSDRMTFLERVINCGAYLGAQLLMNVKFAGKMNVLKTKYNIKPERSFQEALRDTELVIITGDFALEYPQPLLPGNVMVGPLNVRDTDGKALPPDLEEFISNSGGHGFVIVSFGSNLASVLPRSVVDMLATAFGKLKQRVLWRLKGYIPSFLASNIKVMEWLPQNDLLGHKDIKAFVSHVGHNSLYESAYHGVPVVAFPLFADQHGNAKKAEHFGLGLSVNYRSTDAQQLFETLELVINEPRFKAKAMHISGLLKDRRRTSLQETCDWIEYVLRHGGARHLRPQVFNIPWYQYYLLDVMAFLVAIVALVVMVIWMACRCLCNLCCKKSAGSKPKKE